MFKVLLWAFIAETAVGALVKREHSVVSDSLRGMDCSLTGSSVHRILQARIFEQVATPSSKGSSRSRNRACVSQVSCIGKWILYYQCHLGSLYMCVWVCVNCSVVTDCNPMDCSPPGSSVQGILQARVLQWVATYISPYIYIYICVCVYIYICLCIHIYIYKPMYIYQRRQWHPTPVLLLRKSHGQRSLVGSSPWGR